jgi:hypothetical protein
MPLGHHETTAPGMDSLRREATDVTQVAVQAVYRRWRTNEYGRIAYSVCT